MTPDPLAYLALMLLVPATAALFALLRAPVATAAVLIGSVMFMPEQVAFHAPGLPPMDKLSIAGVCALIGCVATQAKSVVAAKPGRGIDLFALLFCLGAGATVATNRDPIAYGPVVLPAASPKDAVPMILGFLSGTAIPFFLGRALFRTSRDLRGLMHVLVVAGLCYVPFIFVELRLSPQLHYWLYGFAQHEFIQTIKAGGGYRPMCFMAHGIALAMFMLATVLAAFATSRVRASVLGVPAGVAAVVLTVTLLLGKSMAAIVYGLVLGPIAAFANAKAGFRVAVLLGALVVAYPALRATRLFPTEQLVELSARVGQDRAASLKFRFDQDDALLAKALDRVWFGWGGWGRNRVYDELGRDVSITDGAWIISLGTNGALGWGSLLGLLVGPIFAAARCATKLKRGRDRKLLSALALITAVSVVDLLPNGLYSYLPLFFAGCLWGLASGLVAEQEKARPGLAVGTTHA